jgi:hypothetical protein
VEWLLLLVIGLPVLALIEKFWGGLLKKLAAHVPQLKEWSQSAEAMEAKQVLSGKVYKVAFAVLFVLGLAFPEGFWFLATLVMAFLVVAAFHVATNK